MSKDRFELLAAIRARPDDDSLRLAFADWLDGQGETDFAHLIRLELDTGENDAAVNFFYYCFDFYRYLCFYCVVKFPAVFCNTNVQQPQPKC